MPFLDFHEQLTNKMVNWPRRVIQIMVYLEVYLVKMVIFHGEVWKKTRPGFSTQVIHNHHGSVKNGTWRPGLRPSQKGYTLCIDIVYTIITMIKIVIIIVIVIINNNNNNNNNNNKYIYIYYIYTYIIHIICYVRNHPEMAELSRVGEVQSIARLISTLTSDDSNTLRKTGISKCRLLVSNRE